MNFALIAGSGRSSGITPVVVLRAGGSADRRYPRSESDFWKDARPENTGNTGPTVIIYPVASRTLAAAARPATSSAHAASSKVQRGRGWSGKQPARQTPGPCCEYREITRWIIAAGTASAACNTGLADSGKHYRYHVGTILCRSARDR